MNIPNKISLLRIAFIPVFVWILFLDVKYNEYIAAFVFILLSLTDALDGYIARTRKQVTRLGKIIDPIADKLLISTALVFFIGKGVDLWMALAIILREIIITVLRLIALSKNVVIAASKSGKLKTISQIVAIAAVIIKLSYAWHLMLIAVILTLWSGLDYFIKITKSKKIIKEKIVNIPNTITLVRFVLVPFFIYYLMNYKEGIAIMLFALIVISDKADGVSARLMNQITEFGKGFDAFTDWTLIISAFIAFVIKGYIALFWAIVLSVAGVINLVMKLVDLKKQKKLIIPFTAQVATAAVYVAIIGVLFNFVYQKLLLVIMMVLVCISVAGYVARVFRLGKQRVKV